MFDKVRATMRRHHWRQCIMCHKPILVGQTTVRYNGKKAHKSCVVYESKNG